MVEGTGPRGSSKRNLGTGMGVGIPLGLVLGLSTDNLALWFPLGFLFGVAIGAGLNKR